VSYLTAQSRMTCGLILLSFLLSPAFAAGHTVGLSWDASTSQNIIGYNIYRGPSANGPYTRINATLNPPTNYTDSTVQGGQTYFYVTTAVDSQQVESGYSNQTMAVIPGGGSGSENALYNFAGGADPKFPYAGLVFDQAGNLYGTTQSGGANSQGTVFEVMHNSDGTWTESVLYSFSGSTDGGQPAGSLVLDAAGNLYGTTNFGGSANCNFGCGTVFKLTRGSGGWSESVLYTFSGGSDGREPYARLLFDPAGNLYGTTLLGGTLSSVCSSGCGTVFKLTPASSGWTESVLYAFTGGSDGASPYDALVSDSASNLYGTVYAGGSSGNGAIFKLTPGSSGWTESVLHTFSGKYDGKYSYGDIMLDPAGNLYGTVFQGGGAAYGAVFELVPNSKGGWQERVLHSFANAPSANPVAGLVMDPAGNLFGTTLAGGKQTSCGSTCGTLFKLSPASGGTWTYKVIHVFGQGADGYHPSGDLILDPTGNLYGTTQAGGAQGSGLVFEIMH
jgi:uncharacterized repeat protein (TIGR03803 family)